MTASRKKRNARKRWKKAGSLACPKLNMNDIVSPSLLDAYLKEGWGAITKNYKEQKMPISPGKERLAKTDSDHFNNLNKEQKKLALEILGSVRKYLVEQIFNCQMKTANNEYFAAGSTNITSDYDVAITGPDANEIMWGMFKKFYQQYGEALPYAFDSNLYSSPLYIHTNHKGEKLQGVRKASNNFPRVDYGKREFTLVPQTDKEMKEELAWAGLKLLPYKDLINSKKLKNLSSILKDSEKLQKYLDKICQMTPMPTGQDKELESFLKGLKSDESKKIVKNYYLQYISQKVCQNYVYKGKKLEPKEIVEGEKKENIFFYSNKANYFSSEAYYTSSAVNAIVVENQLKSKLNYGKRSNSIQRKCYLTAAIENLGDMLNHMSHDKGSLKNTIIKYSKYLYRIYFVLGQAGSQRHKKYAEKLDKRVLPFRKTYNIKQADKEGIWLDVYYNNEDKKDYLKKIKGILFSEIEKEFTSNNTGNKNMKKSSSSPLMKGGKRSKTRKKKRKKSKKTRKKK